MDWIGHQCGRLIWWLNQNATVVLVFITAWYAYLTYRMTKAAGRQATAMLQPVLSFIVHACTDGKTREGTMWIKNGGTQPVTVLDARLTCVPMGRQAVRQTFKVLDDHVIPPGKEAAMSFNFDPDVPEQFVSGGMCGYQLIVVASDLGRQVVAEYEHLPVLGITMCRLGMPLRVRWKYAIRPLQWRYHRIKNWGERRLKRSPPTSAQVGS